MAINKELLQGSLETIYKTAALDYKDAKYKGDEERMWRARRMMCDAETMAAESIGFKFADEMHAKYTPEP